MILRCLLDRFKNLLRAKKYNRRRRTAIIFGFGLSSQLSEWVRSAVVPMMPARNMRHVLLYNVAVLEFDKTEKITIREALGDKFNYDELMAWCGGVSSLVVSSPG